LFSNKDFKINLNFIFYYVYYYKDLQIYTLIFDKTFDIRNLVKKFEQINYTCKVIIDNNKNNYSYTFYNNNINKYV